MIFRSIMATAYWVRSNATEALPAMIVTERSDETAEHCTRKLATPPAADDQATETALGTWQEASEDDNGTG